MSGIITESFDSHEGSNSGGKNIPPIIADMPPKTLEIESPFFTTNINEENIIPIQTKQIIESTKMIEAASKFAFPRVNSEMRIAAKKYRTILKDVNR